MPVGGRGQRDPEDLSGAVAAVNTTADHLTALLTAAIRTKDVTCKRQITSFHPVSTPAQVDRGLMHRPCAPDAVDDRHDIARGQSQGTTSSRISHEVQTLDLPQR